MIPVIFEDDSILVLDKPAGLVTTSSDTQNLPALQDILASDFHVNIERSGIVHRLDKDTSGLLVVAKTAEALEILQTQFKERTVKKEYLALVHGLIKAKGRVEAAIMRNPANREKFMAQLCKVSPCEANKAREAVTEYEPLEKYEIRNTKYETIFEGFNKIQMRKLEKSGYGKFTLVRCFPLTGRTHQIRVHLKYLGFPIIGDEKYGGRKTTRLDHRWIKRQFLHAAHLEFNHPKTGERMKFDSPLPPDLQEALEKLEIKN